MLKREQIALQVNSSLSFLDDKWDQALIGYAESGAPGRHVLPCYGYQVLKTILRDKGMSPVQMYHHINTLVNSISGDKPLMLTKYNRSSLWKTIKDKNYPRWDLLDKAIIGLGSTGWDQRGIVYSKPLCIDLLAASQTSTNQIELLDTAATITQLETSIIPICLGEYTPWFVTPV